MRVAGGQDIRKIPPSDHQDARIEGYLEWLCEHHFLKLAHDVDQGSPGRAYRPTELGAW